MGVLYVIKYDIWVLSAIEYDIQVLYAIKDLIVIGIFRQIWYRRVLYATKYSKWRSFFISLADTILSKKFDYFPPKII